MNFFLIEYSPKRPNTWPVDAKANPQGSPPPHRRSPTRKKRTKVTNAQTSPNPRQAIEALLDRRIREGEDPDFSKKVPLWLIQKVCCGSTGYQILLLHVYPLIDVKICIIGIDAFL